MDRRNLLILECVIVQEVKRSVHIFIRLGVPQPHIITFAFQFLNISYTINERFLAPSGAQGVTLSVCLSVHLAQVCFKQ